MPGKKGARCFRGDPAAALRERTQRSSEGCLIWTGARTRKVDGYGQISVDGHREVAHRVAFELEHGRPVKENHQLHHTCGNRLCVEPSHLVEVTTEEHAQEHPFTRSRRAKIGATKRGERNHNAVLAEREVRAIHVLRGHGLTQKEIGERFGVTDSTVGDIWAGRTWRHLGLGVELARAS